VAETLRLDSNWLREHPLPAPDPHADKNARGRVLAIGGCMTVPGGLLLTATAALRVGAGKVRMASVRDAALALGIAMPEAAVLPLDQGDDGEIVSLAGLDPADFDRTDAVIAGPAMGCEKAAGRIVDTLLDTCGETELVLDAAALMALGERAARLRSRQRPAVLTPHIGEMAAMLECDAGTVDADRADAVRRASDRYGAVVVLKGSTSLIAAPDGPLFAYAGGGVGLATGGSGDVMAGMVAGIAARGASALEATLWAVWLHGEAGRRCAEQMGPLGFLARELLEHVPGLMRAV
jgi:hydroxyethylthiazole kinase-like uncharacterized protein yjeF